MKQVKSDEGWWPYQILILLILLELAVKTLNVYYELVPFFDL